MLTVLGVVFNRRGRQDVQLVKKEVERGNLGAIYHARAFWMRRSGIRAGYLVHIRRWRAEDH